MRHCLSVSFLMSHLFLVCVCADNLVSKGMVHGVSSVPPLFSSSDEFVFIAPMPERADSTQCQFFATYLSTGGKISELFSGFSRRIAEAIGTYSLTPCINIAANYDFTRFAIVYEYMLTGMTPPGSDITIPYNMAVSIAVVGRDGEEFWHSRIQADVLLAHQCRILFRGNSDILLYGPHIGARLYPADGGDYTELPLGQFIGQIAYSRGLDTLFFVRKDDIGAFITLYNVHTGEETTTGLSVATTISDAMMAVSDNGDAIIFRKNSNEICIAMQKDSIWDKRIMSASNNSYPNISANGKYAAWQNKNTSGNSLRIYDTTTGYEVSIPVTEPLACIPVLSPDGYSLLYSADDSNGNKQLWLCDEIGNSCRIQFKRGWNMIGFPFSLDAESQLAFTNSVGGIFVWRNNAFAILNGTLRAGVGCFVWRDGDLELRLTGHLESVLPLSVGWNLISQSAYSTFLKDIGAFSYHRKTRMYVPCRGEKSNFGAYWFFKKQ